jgi:hypothetical protein
MDASAGPLRLFPGQEIRGQLGSREEGCSFLVLQVTECQAKVRLTALNLHWENPAHKRSLEVGSIYTLQEMGSDPTWWILMGKDLPWFVFQHSGTFVQYR